jgi:hypothetical protein
MDNLEICVICGSQETLEVKCKITCLVCGYQEDCSDVVLG